MQQITNIVMFGYYATAHQPLREMEREEILQIKTNKKHSVFQSSEIRQNAVKYIDWDD